MAEEFQTIGTTSIDGSDWKALLQEKLNESFQSLSSDENDVTRQIKAENSMLQCDW